MTLTIYKKEIAQILKVKFETEIIVYLLYQKPNRPVARPGKSKQIFHTFYSLSTNFFLFNWKTLESFCWSFQEKLV